ncbi:MAG: HlyC/CorC family transporter [Deltaproteobacteria bacterium]|jgi:CBS domain containing-hemolysin-like protein|nr:HlyC/CorC family transporter [Deltaproteobacteria bacterium]MBW2531307.1 HlyC/CorC family transporter [Deltaproteobacteria bacterium]
MTPLFVFVTAVVAALVLSFLCSLCESALLGVRPPEVERLVEQRPRVGRKLRSFQRNPDRPVSALTMLNTVGLTAGAVAAGWSFEAALGTVPLWALPVGLAAVVLLLGEALPRAVGLAAADRLAVPVTHGVALLVRLLSPLLALTQALSRGFGGERAAHAVTSIEEIRLLAALGRSQGAVGPRMAQFIEGAASLRELTVHDVMVPRGGVTVLSASRSLEDNLELIRQSGHSRFPFSPSGDLDDIEGIVLAKEVLFQARDGRDELDWSELVSPLLVVPETKPLDQVLRLFQEQRKHLAVVVDEYGGTQGVVTIEDVLEEIVGEIEDETDRVEQAIVKRADGSLACRGWAETRKVFKVLGVEEKAESVTVGGFVAELLGRVPRVDDVAVWNGLRFKVLKASARRAERVEVVPAGPDDPPPSSANAPSAA